MTTETSIWKCIPNTETPVRHIARASSTLVLKTSLLPDGQPGGDDGVTRKLARGGFSWNLRKQFSLPYLARKGRSFQNL
jgi:hypothetical protein